LRSRAAHKLIGLESPDEDDDFHEIFQRYFLWSVQFLGVPTMLLAITLCAVGVILAFTLQKPFQRQLWRPWHWLIFTQLFFFPAIVAVGVLFPAPSGPRQSQGNVTGQHLLDGLFYLSLATTAFWCWRMRGMRWVALSLLFLQEVLLAGAGLVAGMSVSGDWI
jgi:hypothetical protein